MIVGSVIAIGSAVAYSIGKIYIEPRAEMISKAPIITSDTDVNGLSTQFVCVEGNLETRYPIIIDDDEYVSTRTDLYHDAKMSEDSRKVCLVQRTTNTSIDVNVNGVNVLNMIEGVPYKYLKEDYQNVNDPLTVSRNLDVMVKTTLTSPSSKILSLERFRSDGDKNAQVVGYRHDTYAVKRGRDITMFGVLCHDTNSNSINASEVYPCIVSTKTHKEIVQEENMFAKKWKVTSVVGVVAGIAVCCAGYFSKYKSNSPLIDLGYL